MKCEDFDESQDFMQICTGTLAAAVETVEVGVAAAPGATLTQWANGPCAGTSVPACTIPMSQDQLLDVVIQLGSSVPSVPTPGPDSLSVALGIDLLGPGTGTITATPDIGLLCVRSARPNVSGTCSAQIPVASTPRTVTLQASPDPGSAFSGWGASCGGSTGASCALTITGGARVTAGFVLPPPGTPSPAPPAPASLAISPSTVTLDACRGYVLRADAPAGADQRVTWSVQEAGGGTVLNGIYTAPATAGTYHVVAQSQANPSVQAMATVTVNPEKILAMAITPASTQVLPGGGLTFAATVTTTCGTARPPGP
jgi:hypothetical protein